jgi:hypothetical protein
MPPIETKATADVRVELSRPQERMNDIMNMMLKVSLVLFVAGSLLEMGLGLKLQDAAAGLRNLRFLLGVTQ